MTNIGGVKGEGQVPEPGGPKRKKRADSEAFKEMMKVGKAREVEPDEKRRRKRREEAEAEAKAELESKAPSQGAPKAEEKPPAPFEPTIRAPRTTPTEGAEEAPAQLPPPPPPFFPPGTAPTPEISGIIRAPEEPTPAGTPPPAAKKRKKAPVAPLEPKPKIAKKEIKEKAHPPLKAEKKAPPEKPPLREEAKETFFKTLPKPEVAKKPEEKKAEEVPTEIVPPLPPGAWEATKITPEEKKKEKIEEPTAPIEAGVTAGQAPPLEIAIPAPLPAGATPFLNLPPQIMHIFERMVGVMTVMTAAGVTETTIHLDAPQFKDSVFFGGQIIITEFSTAPKAFNIEFVGNSQAITLFKGNVEELVAAFQAGNYNFKVHRIDTSLSAAAREERERVGKVKRKRGKKG